MVNPTSAPFSHATYCPKRHNQAHAKFVLGIDVEVEVACLLIAGRCGAADLFFRIRVPYHAGKWCKRYVAGFKATGSAGLARP